MTMLMAFLPGSRVAVNGVEAKVIGLTVRDDRVASYEVSWWAGRERKTAWVEACEVAATAEGSRQEQIGFL